MLQNDPKCPLDRATLNASGIMAIRHHNTRHPTYELLLLKNFELSDAIELRGKGTACVAFQEFYCVALETQGAHMTEFKIAVFVETTNNAKKLECELAFP